MQADRESWREPSERPSATTRDLTRRLLDRLDYALLGEIYCEHGGVAFWHEQRGQVEELGLAWAAGLAARLPRGGKSLYVGAGVAELPALLTEVLDLARTCVPTNLRGRECASLNASLQGLELDGRLCFQACSAIDRLELGPFDHLLLVGVLADPETFPWLSKVTYGGVPAVELDVEGFVLEREQVRTFVARLLGALALPAVVTTTAEEVPWILETADRKGLHVETDERLFESAVVGDPIGFLRVTAAGCKE